MKKFLFLLIAVWALAPARAQTFDAPDTTQSTVATGPTGQHTPMLIHLPKHYNENTSNYPLIIFYHGLGETGGPASVFYNNQPSGGPAYFIYHGQWPSSFHNFRNGTDTSFIVITPWYTSAAGPSQSASISGWMTNYIIADILSRYRVDINRVYLTGLSAGGEGMMEYMGNRLITTDHGPAGSPIGILYPPAGGVPMSAEIGSSNSKGLADTVYAHKYGFLPVGSPGDTHGDATLAMGYYINQDSAGYVPQTVYNGSTYNGITYSGGHCCWGNIYTPVFTFPWHGATMNIYNYMLYYSLVAAPQVTQADAGPDQNLTACMSSTTLAGNGIPGTGRTIISHGWRQTFGNAAVISDTTSYTPTVTGLTPGTYRFRLRVTDDNGTIAIDSMVITKASPVHPTVSAGTNRVITLPTNSLQLSGTATSNDCATLTQTWSQTSGPNTATISGGTTLTPTASGLIVGIYTFQMNVTTSTGLADSSTVRITVNPSTSCSGSRKVFTISADDQGKFITMNSPVAIVPGDTLIVGGGHRWTYFTGDGLHGTASCPLVVMNDPGYSQIEMTAGIAFTNSTYMHVTGTGNPSTFYGFYIHSYDTVPPVSRGNSLQFSGRAAHCEVDHIDEYLRTYAMWLKNEADCQDSINNWRLEDFQIHDIRAKNINQDGFYIGSTSPSGARQVTCNSVGYFPIPSRLGDIRMWNIIIDSVGRTGIQMSGADSGFNEIRNCQVSRTGYEFNPSQGSGIILGGFTEGYVHDNYVRNTYQHGISCLGAGLSIFENNNVDSSGHIPVNGADSVNPGYSAISGDTRPTTAVWPNSVVNAGGPMTPTTGPAIPLTMQVRNNIVGLTTNQVPQTLQYLDIDIGAGFNSGQPWGTGNIVCNNLLQDRVTPAPYRVNVNITYTPTCALPTITGVIKLKGYKRKWN